MSEDTNKTLAPVHAGHHPFGFSSLQKLAVCSGYRSGGDSDKAGAMGDLCHAALEQATERYVDNVFDGNLSADYTSFVADACSELGLSKFETNNVMNVANQQRDTMEAVKEGGDVYIEERLHLHDETGVEISYGHPDFIHVDSLGLTAVVDDYKFGMIGVTPAWQNLQVIALALALSQQHTSLAVVHVRLWQPGMGECTEHTFPVAELKGLLRKLAAVIARANSDVKKLVAGDHCHYCRHAATCPALFKHLSNASVSLGKTLVDFPSELIIDPDNPESLSIPEDPEVAAKVYYFIKLFEAHFDSWKSQVKEIAERHGDLKVDLSDGTHVDYKLIRMGGSDAFTGTLKQTAKVLDGILTTDELLDLFKKPSLSALQAAAVAKMQDKFEEGLAPSKAALGKLFREHLEKGGLLRKAGPDSGSVQLRQYKPKKKK